MSFHCQSQWFDFEIIKTDKQMMEQKKKVTHRFCLFLSRGVTIVMIKENTCTISAGFFMFIEASNPRKLNDTAVLQSKIFCLLAKGVYNFITTCTEKTWVRYTFCIHLMLEIRRSGKNSKIREISGIWLMSSFLPRNPLTGWDISHL